MGYPDALSVIWHLFWSPKTILSRNDIQPCVTNQAGLSMDKILLSIELVNCMCVILYTHLEKDYDKQTKLSMRTVS
jgi:hypothetical protein